MLVFACSRGSAPVGNNVSGSSPDFSVMPMKDTAALPYAVSVTGLSDGYNVTVELKDRVTVNDLFFKVAYDPTVVSPSGVEFTGSLGKSIDLSITSVRGEVAVGTSRIRNADEAGVSIEGEIANLHFKTEPFIERTVSGQAPTSLDNKIFDLQALPAIDNRTMLTWTEVNLGDYDNSGEVGVPDITPIATNYLVTSGTILDLVDGDESGEIGVSDITLIAENYLNAIAGYRINVFNSGDWAMIPNDVNPDLPYTLMRPADQPTDRRATFSFEYELQPGDEENFKTQAVGPDSSLGILSNSTSGGIDIPFPPRIEDLVAAGSEALEPDEIELTWTPPADPYLDHYEIWWQEGGDGGQPVVLDNNVSSAVSSYIKDGLVIDVTYHFLIRAVNYDSTGAPQRAPFSNLASANVWNGPEPSPPVTDLEAFNTEDDAGIGEGVIKLTWTPPDDPYLETQQLLWEVGGDGTNLTVFAPGLAPDTNTYDVTECSGATYHFMARGVNSDIDENPQYGEDGNVVSKQAWFETPPIDDLETVTPTRNRTTFNAGDTIELSVTTNLDGGEYEDVQTFAWEVISGDATITGGASERDATAEVDGATTAVFKVTVDNTIMQMSAEIAVIGTDLAPAVQIAGVTSPPLIFDAVNVFSGESESAGDYIGQSSVVGLTQWSTG